MIIDQFAQLTATWPQVDAFLDGKAIKRIEKRITTADRRNGSPGS